MKIAKTIYIPENTNQSIEMPIVNSVLPLVSRALFPGNQILPARNVVIVIEVIDLSN